VADAALRLENLLAGGGIGGEGCGGGDPSRQDDVSHILTIPDSGERHSQLLDWRSD
jgi:hypothetical protein